MGDQIAVKAQHNSTVSIGNTSITTNSYNTNSTVNNNNCTIYNNCPIQPHADYAGGSSSSSTNDERIEFNVHDCIESFTGRLAILDQLHKIIQANRETTRLTVLSQTSVISGIGGVGKSETARRYMQLYKGSYHNVIWIGAETPSEIENSFRQLATLLGLLFPPQTLDPSRDSFAIHQVYNALCKRSTLLVFDNAERLTSEEEDNAFGIKPYLPPSVKHGSIPPAILITSRSRNWHPIPKRSIIELSGLEDEECIELLITQLEIPDTPETRRTAMDIKSLCEGLPLAVQQVIAFIKQENDAANVPGNPAFTMADFITSYEERTAEFLAVRPDESPAGKSVFVIFQLTFAKIATKEEIGPLALKYLRMMSYLPPDKIPKLLFPQLLESEERHWKTVRESLKLLQKFNLIQSMDGRGFFSIHRVIQAVALETKGLCVGGKHLVFPEVLVPELIPQFTKFLEQMPSEDASSNTYDILQCAVQLFSRIPQGILTCSTCTLFYDTLVSELESNSMFVLLVSVREKILKTAQSPNKLVKFKRKLALTYYNDGRFTDSQILLEEILPFQSQRFGPESEQVLEIQDLIATILRTQGKYDQALEIQEYIVETYSRVRGGTNEKTMAAKAEVAGILYNQYKFKEALPFLNHLLQESTFTLGPDDDVTLQIERVLAKTLMEVERFEESSNICKRLLPKLENKYGSNHCEVWEERFSLALNYSSMGRLDEAYKMMQEYMQVLPRFFSQNHPHVLWAKSELALTLTKLGRFEEGMSIIQDVKSLVNEKSVTNYLTFSVVYENFGKMLIHEGRLSEAQDVYRLAIRVSEGFLPMDHTNILRFKSLLYSLQEQMSAHKSNSL